VTGRRSNQAELHPQSFWCKSGATFIVLSPQSPNFKSVVSFKIRKSYMQNAPQLMIIVCTKNNIILCEVFKKV
jgi:hypothetical protein